MKFAFFAAFLIIANLAMAANFQDYDPDTIVVTDVIPLVNIPLAFKSNFPTDYLENLHCTKAVTNSECESIKDSIRSYSSHNFPRTCEGKITKEDWATVLYWQLYFESKFNKYGSPGTSSAKGI